ncbi:MAG: glycosyltransferase family 4 protein [Capsulimonadales bacterium]|nr:glycosyltransferase family 4 protein [Capsulimonadales bacterium]
MARNIMRFSHAACTIVSKNYIASARTLAESLRRQIPELPLYVLLVDELDDTIDPQHEPFTLMAVRDLPLPHREPFLFKYDILELNTAVKPYYFAYLAETYGLTKLLYFDPDIYVFSPLPDIWEALNGASIVLTPHVEEPVTDERKPNEIDFLRVGVYNLGFLGMALDHPRTPELLAWWQKRLYDGCRVDLENGYFTDQKWMDLTPALFEDVRILRKPQYNVAYWNLAFRQKQVVWTVAPDGSPDCRIDGEPLGFFHYSGYDPGKPDAVSKHQDRFASVRDVEPVRPLFEFYAERLLANGFTETRKLPYAFGRFANGTRIPALTRRLYRQMPRYETRFPEPFAAGDGSFFAFLNERFRDASAHTRSENGLSRLWWYIWQAHPALQASFPDPAGRDRAAYYAWIHGDGRTVLSDITDSLLPPVPSGTGDSGGTDSALSASPLLTPNPDALAKPRVPPTIRKAIGAPLKALLGSRNRELLEKMYYWALGPEVTRILWSRPSGLPANLPSLPESLETVGQNLPYGINITGYLTGEFGIGEAARSLVKAMQTAEIPVALSNLVAENQSSRDTTFQEFGEERPYGVNVIATNADMVGATLREKGSDWLKGRYNIGFWFWELSEFPETYWPMFAPFQEIWVTSSFCADAIARVAPIPVVKITYPVAFDTTHIRENRARWELPDDAFTFLFLFDYHSFMERKNPVAAIEAFRLAFDSVSERSNALLLLKTMNGDRYPELASRLRERAKGLNIRFLDQKLTRQDTYELIASCDALVSLHRAEGLGLTIAEAMYLGKPVIATAYSGNMDFMDLNNSLPVRFRLVEIEEDCGPYRKGNQWAEADVADAAGKMRQLYEDRDAARRLGAFAAEDIRQRHSLDTAGRQIRRRLDRIRSER